jgi:chemotaxis response regulator CheB
VGASAGGLEAYTEILQFAKRYGYGICVDSAFSAASKSMLSEPSSRVTEMPVTEVDGIAVEPNHVYVIPPMQNDSCSGVLKLAPAVRPVGIYER